MTFVQTHPPLAAGRLDEGPALQRRLLQDLERQWLESWTVADQLQGRAPAAPAPAPAPEAAALGSIEAFAPAQPGRLGPTSVKAPVEAPERSAVGGKDAAASHQARSMDQRPESAGQPEAAGSFEPQGRPIDTAIPKGEHRAGPAHGSADVRGDAPVLARHVVPEAPNLHPDLAEFGPQGGLAPPIQAFGGEGHAGPAAGLAGLQAPLTQSAALAGPGASVPLAASLDFAGSGVSPASFSLAATVNSKAQLMGFAPGTPRSASGGEALKQEKSAAPTPRWHTSSAVEDAPPGPRRLMLRETAANSVLASMRDGELSAQQSQSAADGLARALMMAGYARVQVVVNGQQQRIERAADDANPNPRSPASESPSATSTHPQERRHGR